MSPLGRFIRAYRLVLAAALFGAMIFYCALALTAPEVATPLGVGLIALALLLLVLVQVFDRSDGP